MPVRHVSGLGKLIPLILGVTLTADVCAHFLPVDWFAFRAWEAVFRYPITDGRCTPQKHYVNTHSFGDLPSLANQPAWRVYRLETFTTDDFGFRKNPGEDPSKPYDAILLGDSFAIGSRLNDEETLPAQLEHLTGRQVFNAGCMKIDLRRTLQLLDRLGMKKGIVFYEYLERLELLPAGDVTYHTPKPRTWSVRLHKVLENSWDGFWSVCPIEILSQRVYKKWQNDRILLNPYKERVVADRLKNGDRILFLPDELDHFTRERSLDVSGFVKFKEELAARGFQLEVILLPDKHTVYAPLLEHPPADPPVLYLNALEKSLRQAGIPAFNVLPAFRRVAAERLEARDYLYFSDDTHWNARGVEVAARALRGAFRQ